MWIKFVWPNLVRRVLILNVYVGSNPTMNEELTSFLNTLFILQWKDMQTKPQKQCKDCKALHFGKPNSRYAFWCCKYSGPVHKTIGHCVTMGTTPEQLRNSNGIT